MTTTAYTDGACIGNPGPGGWAWAVPGGAFASGAEPATTNQRMEIRAALEAVRSLEGPVEVVSDSTYVVNCFRDGWWRKWIAHGWLNSQKKPVANRDLWEPLVELYRAEEGRVRFRWVKGHSEDPMNDLVDRLAVEAAQTQQGRRGDRPPALLGPADDRVGRASAGAAVTAGAGPAPPGGHRVLVAGLRPPALGGYDTNPVADSVRARLAEILRAKRSLHPDLVVVTGLALGAEQLGAEAAAEAGVPYFVAVPYPDQESKWPVTTQARYRRLLDGAAGTALMQTKAPATRAAAGAALSRRDEWLHRNADEAVVVWDGSDPAVRSALRSIETRVGEDDVWIVEPSAGA